MFAPANRASPIRAISADDGWGDRAHAAWVMARAGSQLLWVCPTSCGRSSSSYVLGLHDAPQACSPGGTQALPVLAQVVSVHAWGSLTSRDTSMPRQNGTSILAFPFSLQGRHPVLSSFRGSIPSLHVPLSTLRSCPYGLRRWAVTVLLTLSFTTTCRFIPALKERRHDIDIPG